MAFNISFRTMMIVFAILVVGYLLFKNNQAPIHNEGSLAYDDDEHYVDNSENVVQNESATMMPTYIEDTGDENEANVVIPSESEMDQPIDDDEDDDADVYDDADEDVEVAEGVVEADTEMASQEVLEDEGISGMLEAEDIGEELDEKPVKSILKAQAAQKALSAEEMDYHLDKQKYTPPEKDYKEWLHRKFSSRNRSKCGYKRSNYEGSVRGNLGPSQWDDFFDQNNNIIRNSQHSTNDNFVPVDETNNSYASFVGQESKGYNKAPCGSNHECDPEDLFDINKYLPQEVNDDWFEVHPEPISVKNRHLINVTRPHGVNTIGVTLRNASHDLRGNIACPKFTVSPWLQSSIEPDINIKPFC